MSYEINRMRSQLADLAEQHQRLQADFEAERRARIETQAEMDLAKYNVKQSRQLSRLLHADGALVEQGGELRLRTPQGVVSIEQGLRQLLETPDYEHYRPSSLGSKGNTSAVDSGKPVGRILQGGDRLPTDAEIAAALANPGESELFTELEALMEPTTPPQTTSSSTATQPTYDSVRPQTQGQSSVGTDVMFSEEEFQAAASDPTKFDRLLAKVDAMMSRNG